MGQLKGGLAKWMAAHKKGAVKTDKVEKKFPDMMKGAPTPKMANSGATVYRNKAGKK